jgi:hypothetical protein
MNATKLIWPLMLALVVMIFPHVLMKILEVGMKVMFPIFFII